jgi:hypothetical protein
MQIIAHYDDGTVDNSGYGAQSFAAGSLFTASDADGDAIATYAFWNSGTGADISCSAA